MAQAAIRNLDAGKWKAVQYDFAVHGGAISTIGMGVNLALGETVVQSAIEVLTVPVGVGASIAVQANAANDVISVAAISGAPWSTTGFKDGVSAGAAADFKKCTAAREVSVLISGAALTAGKFNIYLLTVNNAVA